MGIDLHVSILQGQYYRTLHCYLYCIPNRNSADPQPVNSGCVLWIFDPFYYF